MSDGFKGFAKPADDKKFRLYIKNKAVNELIKEYKKLKKYQNSFERRALSYRLT